MQFKQEIKLLWLFQGVKQQILIASVMHIS